MHRQGQGVRALFGVKGLDRHPQRPRCQAMLHATALSGNPYDGHTLGSIRCDREADRLGHRARRVFISGQKRGVFGVIAREFRRRSAIEPIIGPMKSDGHLGRCHLKGRQGDAINVITAAVGQNLSRVLAWLILLPQS
jgi:IS5 family transposase